MRKESLSYERPEIERMESYHGGSFEQLTLYNSDRKVALNPDYTVSSNNTASTLKIMKAGTHGNAFGLELETVGDNVFRAGSTVYTNLVKLIFDKAGFDGDFFKYESDCTVHVECITQTFTKAWLRNNYKCFKAMYEMFETFGITTNDERCGMHVNIDLANFGSTYEAQIENVRKLGYIINKHYSLFKVAFNRTGTTRWCPQMNTSKEYWKTNAIIYFPTDHSSCCINLGHVRQSRIEIRLVGGQKNFPCFRNTMETVFHLINAVKKLSWNDCDDLVKIFSGCNNYVFDRLSTNCYQAGTINNADLEKIRPTVEQVRYI